MPPTERGVVRVHPLVQRVVREHTPIQEERDLAVAAADALLAIWPEVERDRAYGQTLRTNATALRQTTADSHLNPAAHLVLFRTREATARPATQPAPPRPSSSCSQMSCGYLARTTPTP
jgi:hypothetical protein